MCQGLLPVLRLYEFDRMKASVPKTRPRLRYRLARKITRAVVRIGEVYAQASSEATLGPR